MTSIEYLFNELWETPKDKFTWHSILNKAKEMHKAEIINTWYNGYINQSPMIDEENCGEQFYQETFGGNGNDNSPKEGNKTSFGEISDDEIEKASRDYTFNEYQKVIDYENYDTYNDFINGAKWYKEQLKQRQ
jgi:hypothetical protein